ncbi:MAG: discoidin domain-containing protein, partial [Acidimicrobiales bacterium]
LAMLVGSAISAIRLRVPVLSVAAALLATAALVADNPALFNGDAEAVSFFTQPAKLPAYETKAMNYLNSVRKQTRVLAIPGNDFASYRWGDTVDTPQPAFLNRPFVTREQQVMGSMATADTLFAMDDPIQSGVEQWNSLSQMARLMSAGDVLVENDQRYEHYGTPQPQLLAQQLQATPSGLSDPVAFGAALPNLSSYEDIDGQDLASLTPPSWPSPLVDYTVADPRPITRGESDTGAVIVAGDATGLEDMADLGLLDTNSAIYYSGTLDTDHGELDQLLQGGASLVVTDTNRKEAFRWDTLTANYGETETPNENPAKTDPSDSPIELFPGAPSDSKTTASYFGAVDVSASSYGNSVSYTPEDRPDNAIDGNVDTSWNTGTFVPDPAGQWWQVTFADPTSANEITLVQPQTGTQPRWITRVTLTFDGSHRFTTDLGPASRSASGQVVSFPAQSFRTLRVTIDATSNDHMRTSKASAVGFAEVEIPGQHVVEVIQMPTDLLDAAGAASIDNRLTISMSRQRVSAYEFPVRTDPETTISREFQLPTARDFRISASASLSSLVPDDEIDRLLGRPESTVAYSKGRLPGCLSCTASAAAGGNPGYAWEPGFGSAYQDGEWLEYDLPSPLSFDHLDLQLVADGRHSVPTSLTVSAGNQTRSVQLPPITDSKTPGATVSVPVSFPALTGRDIRLTVTGVRLEKATNYYSPSPTALPIGIADVGIPGVHAAPLPPNVPDNCVSNLISIDGTPISVEVQGATSTALAGGEMSLVPCGPDANGIALAAGDHIVETALGHSVSTGWNVDQLTLDSAPGGAAGPAATFDALPAAQPGAAPSATVLHRDSTSEEVAVKGADAPFELVLGQSVDAGWKAVASSASVAGHERAVQVDLGAPQLVDGFANGWQVTSSDLRELGGGAFTVSIEWSP